MDDDIYEKFEISDWDLENEFNPKRFKRRLTKKQQIYGIWASSESEDENDGGKSAKGPINFVSGGFKDNHKDDDNQTSSANSAFRRNAAERKASSHPVPEIAGLRRGDKFNTNDAEFGKWEAHTKGIGAKLLLQMGYKPGKGLGKNLQGITAPIEANKRPGHGSVGFYGPEKKQTAIKEDNNVNARSGKEETQWKKSNVERKPKVQTKYVLKLVDDVLAENGVNMNYEDNELNKVKVIDMTGPQQRILSGYHEIHHKKHKTLKEEDLLHEEEHSSPAFPITEVEQNLESLLSLSEDSIRRNAREIKEEKEKVSRLEEERLKLRNIIKEEKKKIENVERVINTVNDINSKYSTTELTLSQILDFCDNTYNDLLMDSSKICFNDIISSFLFPFVEKELNQWNPIVNPQFSLPLFERLKSLLLKIDETLYESLLWDIWTPIVRRKLLEWKSIRQCDEIIKFLETWKPLLPLWLLNNIIEQIILPRIEKEVEEWNPLTDTVPVHSWIHPWLPVMGDRSLETVYIPIRQKLSNALVNWHPCDCSAKLILQPWKDVFSAGTWDSFLLQNIVPKLEMVMQSYDINPQAQRLDVWQWLMAWSDMLHPSVICSILEKHFLPKWLQVLFEWLSNNPNFDEVSRWYLGWKSMFSDQLLNNPVVKDAFSRALEMMNYAVSSPMGIRGYNLTSFVQRHSAEVPRYCESFGQSQMSSETTVNPSLKRLLERRAEEHAILFMPVANKYHEAKQVYKFGNLTIYLNQQVIFVYKDGKWLPTSLQSLIDSAVQSNI